MNPLEKSRIINYAYGAASPKQAYVARLKREYEKWFDRSLEYEVDATRNGVPQSFIARRTESMDRYALSSRANETFYAGDTIQCFDSHWIVTDVAANKDVYTQGYMLRCNLLFKFQIGDKIVERWGVLDPGVYSTTINDTYLMPELQIQYKIYLPYDDETKYFTFDKRFAAGVSYDGVDPVLLVYRITGYDPTTENYGNDKLLVLKCKSDTYDPTVDNFELGICNYVAPGTAPPQTRCRLVYEGDPVLRAGGYAKTFTAVFEDAAGNPVEASDVVWDVTTVDNTGLSRTVDGNTLTLRLGLDASLGTLYMVSVRSDTQGVSDMVTVQGVGMV